MKKIFSLVLISLAAGLMLCGQVNAKAEKVTIMLENVYPATHARLGEKAVIGQYLDAVEERSNGLVEFERHWGGEPVPSKEGLEALSMGTIDMLVAFPLYYSGKVGLSDVAAMPKNFMTFDDIYDLWWNTPLGDIMDKSYQKRANAKYLFPAIFAPENFQISKKTDKIRHFEDLKNLKIRAGGGIANQTVKALGGSPVTTVGGEYYTAMQRGTIDAGLMTSYSLETYKMWEVCDQIVNPPIFNHCFVGVWMNLDKWKSLDSSIQDLLVNTAKFMDTHWIAYVEMDDARIKRLATEKHGVEYYTLPPEDQNKMWEAVTPVWDDYVENCEKQGLGEEAKKIRAIIQERFQSY